MWTLFKAARGWKYGIKDGAGSVICGRFLERSVAERIVTAVNGERSVVLAERERIRKAIVNYQNTQHLSLDEAGVIDEVLALLPR